MKSQLRKFLLFFMFMYGYPFQAFTAEGTIEEGVIKESFFSPRIKEQEVFKGPDSSLVSLECIKVVVQPEKGYVGYNFLIRNENESLGNVFVDYCQKPYSEKYPEEKVIKIREVRKVRTKILSEPQIQAALKIVLDIFNAPERRLIDFTEFLWKPEKPQGLITNLALAAGFKERESSVITLTKPRTVLPIEIKCLLPFENMMLILKYSSPETLSAFSQTCSAAYTLVREKENELWFQVLCPSQNQNEDVLSWKQYYRLKNYIKNKVKEIAKNKQAVHVRNINSLVSWAFKESSSHYLLVRGAIGTDFLGDMTNFSYFERSVALGCFEGVSLVSNLQKHRNKNIGNASYEHELPTRSSDWTKEERAIFQEGMWGLVLEDLTYLKPNRIPAEILPETGAYGELL